MSTDLHCRPMAQAVTHLCLRYAAIEMCYNEVEKRSLSLVIVWIADNLVRGPQIGRLLSPRENRAICGSEDERTFSYYT